MSKLSQCYSLILCELQTCQRAQLSSLLPPTFIDAIYVRFHPYCLSVSVFVAVHFLCVSATVLCCCRAMTIKALKWIELKSWLEEWKRKTQLGFRWVRPVWCELGVCDLVSEPRMSFLSATSKPCSSRLVSQTLALHIIFVHREEKYRSLMNWK